jgi:hypothetical protein
LPAPANRGAQRVPQPEPVPRGRQGTSRVVRSSLAAPYADNTISQPVEAPCCADTVDGTSGASGDCGHCIDNDPAMLGFVDPALLAAAANTRRPPNSQRLRLMPPSLKKKGSAILHVDVPEGSRVKVANTYTQSRNWSRYRHYRITGLTPGDPQPVSVKVWFYEDRPGCKQDKYECCKRIWLMPGDNENLRFERGDFPKPCEESGTSCPTCLTWDYDHRAREKWTKSADGEPNETPA